MRYGVVENISKALLLCILLPAVAAVKNDVAITDAYHTSILQAQIMQSPELAGYKIKISSKNNIVKFVGYLPSQELAIKLIELAMIIDSVESVDTMQLVIANTPARDIKSVVVCGMLRGLMIRNQLYTKAEVDAQIIRFRCNGAKLYISGLVRTDNQIDRIMKIAETLNGISQIIQTLQVGNFN